METRRRRLRPGRGNYSIWLDGEWTLEDLYIFPHTFEQVYFFFQSLSFSPSESLENERVDEERVEHAFAAFPWHGGYSAVNFYNALK